MTGDAPGRSWRDEAGLHVDTRGLAPPDPLIAVLWHLAQPEQEGPVIAYFDRNPVHLYDEIARLGWRHERADAGSDAVRLVLRPVR